MRQALRYASRLRLPRDVSGKEIERNIDDVLDRVSLLDRADTVIRNLSGGQQKRVSVAIELLSRPAMIFMDEATSGLDASSDRDFMMLFRSLADEGITIACITHHLENLMLCDKLVCLIKGKLVFYGAPRDMLEHFDISQISDVLDLESRHSVEEMHELYKQSDYWQPEKNIDGQELLEKPPVTSHGWDAHQFILQTILLTKRYVRLLTLDRMMPMALIMLGPLIAGLICFLTMSQEYELPLSSFDDSRAYEQTQKMLSFGGVVTVMFLALFGAVQEVVKELRVYHHERFATLQIFPYVISKFIPLGFIGVIQSVLVLFVIREAGGFDLGTTTQQLTILIGASLTGTALGLAISAGVPAGNDRGGATGRDPAMMAVMAMNAFVIPQVLFAGAMMPLESGALWLGRLCITSYWTFQAFMPMLQEKFPVGYPWRGDDPPAIWLSIVLIYMHVIVLLAVFCVAMVRKDGPGGFAKLAKAIPRGKRSN